MQHFTPLNNNKCIFGSGVFAQHLCFFFSINPFSNGNKSGLQAGWLGQYYGLKIRVLDLYHHIVIVIISLTLYTYFLIIKLFKWSINLQSLLSPSLLSLHSLSFPFLTSDLLFFLYYPLVSLYLLQSHLLFLFLLLSWCQLSFKTDHISTGGRETSSPWNVGSNKSL